MRRKFILAGCLATLAFPGGAVASIGSMSIVMPKNTPIAEPEDATAEAALIAKRAAVARQAKITDVEALLPVERIRGCGPRKARAWKTPRSTMSAPLQAALQKAQSYSDEHAGLGLIVMHKGKLLYERYADGIGSNTQFTSQSMHKTLLALAILTAVDDGIISSLDDGLGKYIPEWRNDSRGDITLRQAMQMASGLEPFPLAKGDPRALALLYGSNSVGTALSAQSAGPAGAQFIYKNLDAQLTGHALSNALAKVGKGRYVDYLSKRIWCPLGNGDAQVQLDRVGGSPQFFAGVNASLRDWARVGEAIRTGRLGSHPAPSLLDQMLVPSAANPNYGLLTWLGSPKDGKRRYSPDSPVSIPHSKPYLVDDIAFMDGFGGQRVYISRKAELVIARFGATNLSYDDAVIPNLLLEPLSRTH